jgi:hypothetical protein
MKRTRPELWNDVRSMLREHLPPRARIVAIARRPCASASSYALQELDVDLSDGRRLALMLKDLGRDSMLARSRRVRPAFLHDPRREIDTYRALVGFEKLGPPVFYGAIVNRRAARYRLLLERVDGLELQFVGDFNRWLATAAWLGAFHRRFASKAAALRVTPTRLLSYDREFLALWFERARRRAEDARGVDRRAASRLKAIERLANTHERCVAALAALPPVLMHGEFFPSNILIQPRRVCPVDWETAAIGPGLVDVAALSAGGWTEDEKLRLLRRYQTARTGRSGPLSSDLKRAFDASRFHLAMRMLGWPDRRGWLPPAVHAFDWLGEATRIARRLGR